jgi:DNA-binding response OmpR family regulator
VVRILLIEDHERLSGYIKKGLSQAGFSVDVVALLADAEAALAGTRYAAIVLDLGLPDGDGLDLLCAFRAKGAQTPILILTARDALPERVGGLNAGADDYLVKPFDMDELVARLRALLRRPSAAMGVLLELGNLTFDSTASMVRVSGAPLTMSRRESGVLEILLRRAGRVVPKEAIEESLYGFNEEIASNAVEVAVHRLRKKLRQSGASVVVNTLRGVGYWLTDDGG